MLDGCRKRSLPDQDDGKEVVEVIDSVGVFRRRAFSGSKKSRGYASKNCSEMVKYSGGPVGHTRDKGFIDGHEPKMWPESIGLQTHHSSIIVLEAKSNLLPKGVKIDIMHEGSTNAEDHMALGCTRECHTPLEGRGITSCHIRSAGLIAESIHVSHMT